jgi:nucleotide-binding universal stress UspA family protein
MEEESIADQRCALVVGVDLADDDNAALDCAITCAASFDRAEVHAVYVAERASVDSMVSLPLDIVPTDGDEWEQHHRLTRELEVRCEARRRRLMALGMSLPPTRLCAHLVRGNPAERIVDLADSLDAELVVMATHGRRRWRRMLLGTIAEEVVRNAPCAVLVVGEQRQLSDVPGNAQHRRDRHTIRAASSS